MMQQPIKAPLHAEQIICTNCRHSKVLEATTNTLGCMQTVDPVSGGTVNYAATWRLKGMPEAVAAQLAEDLEVCGPQGRFYSEKPPTPRKKPWWINPMA